jgi:hypothetical protein
MEQKEFVRHPVYANYEASRDGVIRHCRLKKPVGSLNKFGYFRINMNGNKNYFSHRFIYECYFGVVKDGFVIDHFDGNPKNNNLSNLQTITPSQNSRRGNTGRCKLFGKRAIKSINVETDQEMTFPSINAAARYFSIHPQSVQFVANNITKSAFSKKYNQWIIFKYII